MIVEFKTALRAERKKEVYMLACLVSRRRDQRLIYTFSFAPCGLQIFSSEVLLLNIFLVAVHERLSGAPPASENILKTYKPFQWIPWLVGR